MSRIRNVTYACLLLGAALSLSPLTEPDAHAAADSDAADFRVRLARVLKLGQAKGAQSREARTELISALNDAHATVRTGAAAAMLSLGDTSVIPALESALKSEKDARAKAAIERTLSRLKDKQSAARASLYVQLGKMSAGDPQLSRVLRSAIEQEAGRYATIVDESAKEVPSAVREKRAAFVRLDGSLTSVTPVPDTSKGLTGARAVVDFSVLREQTLRGTLKGAATSRGVGSQHELSADAVRGAVESALRDSEKSLRDAGK
jgi:hypothetical protein